MTALAQDVADALGHSQTVDITTTGRTTGQSRRIESTLHHIEGRPLVSGQPGFSRGWMANLGTDPAMTLHLRRPAVDVPARARIVTDLAGRRALLAPIARLWRIPLPAMVESAPLIEITLD